MIKVRNNRSGQVFEPTRVLMDKVADKSYLEIVKWREDMQAFASDSEHDAFVAGRKSKPAAPAAKDPGLVVPVGSDDPNDNQDGGEGDEGKPDPEASQESESEGGDASAKLQALRESLLKKSHEALVKEATSAKLPVKASYGKEKIVDAILELYK